MAIGGSVTYDVSLDTSKVKGQIAQLGNDFTSISDSSEGIGEDMGGKLLSGLKRVFTVAAVGKFIQDTVWAGANLEQSIGGAETLFGDFADSVIENANNAWRTAGVSANQYLEGVNSFAASLLQSTKGNAEEAAKIADMAFVDMSDNANKFGTDMQSIQNAYQGFAKQNYTMLDNLKLGYGGTKTEMERLLRDAEKLSGVKYNISSLADVYSAIHVIQEEMKVTGTTMLESRDTFSGSFNSMKSAWENFQAALSLGENVGETTEALIDSAITFAGNGLRMISNIFKELPKVVVSVANKMVANFGTSLTSLTGKLKTSLPAMVKGGMELINSLLKGILQALPSILAAIPTIIMDIVQALLSCLPELLSGVGEIIKSVVNAVTSSNWFKLGVQVVTDILNGVKNFASNLWNYFKEIANKAWNSFKSINWIQLGKDIITNIVDGIKNLAANVGNALLNVATSAFSSFASTLSNWWNIGRDIILGIKNGINDNASQVYSAVGGVARNALGQSKQILMVQSPSKKFRDEVGKWIPLGIAEGIEDEAESVGKAMSEMLDGIDSSVSVGDFNKTIAFESNNDNIISILESYLPQIARQKDVYLDTGKLVGEISGSVNRKLGLAYNGQV